MFLGGVREAASKGGRLAALSAKRKTENGLEAPRATIPLGGGTERTWSSWAKWKWKMNPGLDCVCWDAGSGSSASPGWAINIRDNVTTVTAEGINPQQPLTFPRAAGPAEPIHSTAEVLHHPQVSPDLPGPFGCHVTILQRVAGAPKVSHCSGTVSASVLTVINPMLNFPTLRRDGLLSAFLIEPCLGSFRA